MIFCIFFCGSGRGFFPSSGARGPRSIRYNARAARRGGPRRRAPRGGLGRPSRRGGGGPKNKF